MVMRRAANLPIEAADRDKPAFLMAGSILHAAHMQQARTGLNTDPGKRSDHRDRRDLRPNR